MARIRTIKPEFWVDEKVVECSAFARLLFIGLWNFADDDGRMEYREKKIGMQIFPADSLDISGLVGELRRENLVEMYVIDDKEYLRIRGFSKHQKIDKRLKSKHPEPPTNTNSPRPTPTEGKGREGIKEGKGGDGVKREQPETENPDPTEKPPPPNFEKNDYSNWKPDIETVQAIKMGCQKTASGEGVTDEFIEDCLPEFRIFARDNHTPNRIASKFIKSVTSDFKRQQLQKARGATTRHQSSTADYMLRGAK